MATTLSLGGTEGRGKVTRKRAAHKKSRRGCRNCRLRRVKCDEAQPHCQRCVDFGVSCNFDPKIPDLQMVLTGSTTLKSLEDSQILPLRQNNDVGKVSPPLDSYPGVSFSQDPVFPMFNRQTFEVLSRFSHRTILSVGSPKSAALLKDVTVELACSHPYLMHVVQILTLLHDRHLSDPFKSRQTTAEIYSLSRAAALFNEKLSSPVQPDDRDALWATAALLGTVSFSWINATTPEEAWPLAPTDPNDLEWIKMSESKGAIFQIADPLRPDSVFYPMAEQYVKNFRTSVAPESGTGSIPYEFVQLCELNSSSNAENSPYFLVCHKMASLLPVETTRNNMVQFLGFLSHMPLAYKRLLRKKDPRALLLLAYWYAKVGRTVWFLERRAILECQAICLYLEKYHPNEKAIHNLLQFPKSSCGLRPR